MRDGAASIPYRVKFSNEVSASDSFLVSSVGIGADETAAAIAQKYLGWSETRVHEELATYRRYVKRFHPRILSGRDLSPT